MADCRRRRELLTGRAIFTEAYAVIPQGRDERHRHQLPAVLGATRGCWILSRPLSGFAETFSQYIMEVAPGGGSDRPEPDAGAEGVLFVVEGELTVDARRQRATSCSPAALPICRPASAGRVRNDGAAPARFHWIRKAYELVDGLDVARAGLHQRERHRADRRCPTPTAAGRRRASSTRPTSATTCTSPSSPSSPAPSIPFEETHVMEHGLYVLEGKAVYRLNQDWVEVEAGDLCGCAPSARRPATPAARAVPLPALQGRQPPHEARQLRPRRHTS